MITRSFSTYLLLGLFVGVSFIANGQTGGYKPGDKAKNFHLKNIDGKPVSLQDNPAAKGYILVFTCNHCPFAKAYEDRIIALHQKYASKGYPVIAINPNDPVKEPEDSFAAMAKRSKEKNFPFPYLLDETQETAKAYGATRTPHVYLLKKSGTDHIVEYIGAIDDNSNEPEKVTKKYLEEAIESLIVGKAVALNSTKAIGCGIKWK